MKQKIYIVTVLAMFLANAACAYDQVYIENDTTITIAVGLYRTKNNHITITFNENDNDNNGNSAEGMSVYNRIFLIYPGGSIRVRNLNYSYGTDRDIWFSSDPKKLARSAQNKKREILSIQSYNIGSKIGAVYLGHEDRATTRNIKIFPSRASARKESGLSLDELKTFQNTIQQGYIETTFDELLKDNAITKEAVAASRHASEIHRRKRAQQEKDLPKETED